jgi:hypothetical protein
VQEGLFVSSEPAQTFDQALSFPNQDGEVGEEVVALLILELAEQLGIDPKFIRLEGPANEPVRARVLGEGASLKFVILTNDAASLAATLSSLTSSSSFWAGFNHALANASIPLVNATGVAAQASAWACNTHFRHDNVSQTCIAELMQCDPGKFAASGSGSCGACPAGKYSQDAGAFGCDGCVPGRYSHDDGAVECGACLKGEYQSSAGERGCKRCALGKYTNIEGTVICSGVKNAKSYITAEVEVGQSGGPNTDEQQQDELYIEVGCPKAGLQREVDCGNGRLSFKSAGFFHDGLEATDAAQTRWAHRNEYIMDERTQFYPCPCQSCCVIDHSRGNLSCTEGNYGILCGTCLQGHFKVLDGSCTKCTSETTTSRHTIVLVMLVFVVIAFVIYRRMNTKRRQDGASAEVYKRLHVFWTKWRDSIVVIAKQLLGFFQVVLLLRTVYRIPVSDLDRIFFLVLTHSPVASPPFQTHPTVPEALRRLSELVLIHQCRYLQPASIRVLHGNKLAYPGLYHGDGLRVLLSNNSIEFLDAGPQEAGWAQRRDDSLPKNQAEKEDQSYRARVDVSGCSGKGSGW